jgi:hypothetical protein
MAFRWVAAAVAVLALVLAPVPAAAAPTVINFDNLADDTFVTTQYPGVTFAGPTWVQTYSPGMARSEPNGIECGIPPGGEFCGSAMTATFDQPQARVRVFVGYCCTHLETSISLRAYNASNAEVDVATTVIPEDLSNRAPINRELQISLGINVITRVTISRTTGAPDGVAADDLEFARAPDLVISPDPVDFGDVVLGSSGLRTATLTNVGDDPLQVGKVTVAPSEFSKASGTACEGTTIASGGSCTLDIRFTPSALGRQTGTLTVDSNEPGGQDTARLIGEGVRQPPVTATTTTQPPPSTTTASLPPPPTTSTTIPPTTVGATLQVTPGIGPPGFVTLARGTGFPEGAVELSWLPGLGTTNAIAGADGVFDVQVLIFPNDVVGRRTLVAAGGGVVATTEFLVVPDTVKPSGTDVTQLNRARRHVNR